MENVKKFSSTKEPIAEGYIDFNYALKDDMTEPTLFTFLKKLMRLLIILLIFFLPQLTFSQIQHQLAWCKLPSIPDKEGFAGMFAGVSDGHLICMGGAGLFWGSEDGFNIRRKSWIPSFGPHGRIVTEAGSISRREPFQTYTSNILHNTTRDSSFILSVTGRFNDKQYCTPEIIIEQGNGASVNSPIQAIQSSDETPVSSWHITVPVGAKFRYRLKLWGGYAGGGTMVSSVKMVADGTTAFIK